MIKYFPLTFAPDLDPSWSLNPGILTDVTNMVPTKRNTFISYSANNSFGSAFAEASFGISLTGIVLKDTLGVGRLFVATNTRLMEATGLSTWTDRSKSGVDYAFDTNHRYNFDWCFTTFGDHVIAVSKRNPPQLSSSATAFVDLGGGPPKAACCTTQKNFVLLGNCNDGTNDLGDQVWWSGLGNDQTWTVSASTQAGNYRLRETPGNITALVNMRDSVIAYKEDSIYLGDYQNSALQWTWRLVTDKVGCASVHGIQVVDGIHYFCHRTGVYRFDGASVQPLGKTINSYLFTKVGDQSKYALFHSGYDEESGTIFWYFSSTAIANNYIRDRAFTYNPYSGAFGYIANPLPNNESLRCVIKGSLSDFTAWNSTFGSSTYRNSILLFGATNAFKFVALGATASATASVSTGDIGDEFGKMKIRRIQPRLLSYSGTMGTATVTSKPYEVASTNAVTATADSTKARWDMLGADRWFNATLSFPSYTELAGLYIDVEPAGKE